MISVQLPPEIEQHVRNVAAQQQRDVLEVAADLLRDAVTLAKRRAFNEELKLSTAEGLAGDVVSEEELLAELDADDE